MPEHPPEHDPAIQAPRPESGNWKDATDHLWRTLQSINEWTRFADAKAAAVLTANGVLGTLAAGLIEKYWAQLKNSPGLSTVALLCGLALLASSGFCIKCLFPRRSVPSEGRPDSLLFFHHIALSEKPEDYLKRAVALAEPDVVFREVGTQVWANARVAREKHTEVAFAIAITGASLLVALAAWVVVFLVR